MAEPQRSNGIGRRLLAAVAEAASELGAARIEWTVAPENARAQAFYQRAGAELATDALLVRLSAEGIAALAERRGHDA